MYNDLPFKGPVTCVEYHPFENYIAICGLGGRTVSVCLYRHSDLMQGELELLQNNSEQSTRRWVQQHNNSPDYSTKHVDILKVTPTSTHRRPVLQKSITVDHSSSSRSPHHEHKHLHNNEECEQESTERSRMKRAIKKLETALKMRSLDHS